MAVGAPAAWSRRRWRAPALPSVLTHRNLKIRAHPSQAAPPTPTTYSWGTMSTAATTAWRPSAWSSRSRCAGVAGGSGGSHWPAWAACMRLHAAAHTLLYGQRACGCMRPLHAAGCMAAASHFKMLMRACQPSPLCMPPGPVAAARCDHPRQPREPPDHAGAYHAAAPCSSMRQHSVC